MFKEVSLRQGRKLTVREVQHGSRWWVVFLGGSAPSWTDLEDHEERAFFRQFREVPNLLVVGKPGLRPDGRVNWSQFEAAFRRRTRVQDYYQILKSQIPRRDRILLMGFSEGAYLAPEIANLDRRVSALALLSGGTRSWLDEEIYKMGANQETKVLARVGRVYARPKSEGLTWYGNSHVTWMSYDNDDTKDALTKVRVPVLAIHANRDRMIDLDSARSDLKSLKKTSVEMHLLKGVDHTFGSRWPHVLRITGSFFSRYMNEH